MSSNYAPLPSFPLRLPFDSWEKFVREDCPTKHGAKWKVRRCAPDDQYKIRNERADPRFWRYRQTPSANKWTITYECHRAGKPNSTAHQRPVQKKSKLIDCEAKLKVEYKYSDPDHVLLSVSGEHNHVVGGDDDVGTLPLSDGFRKQLVSHIESGMKLKDVYMVAQREAELSQANARDLHVNPKEIRNLMMKIHSERRKKGEIEKEPDQRDNSLPSNSRDEAEIDTQPPVSPQVETSDNNVEGNNAPEENTRQEVDARGEPPLFSHVLQLSGQLLEKIRRSKSRLDENADENADEKRQVTAHLREICELWTHICDERVAPGVGSMLSPASQTDQS